jgi:glycerophosphoryl diester phosphodiesterase
MDTWLRPGRPLVIAHRGHSMGAPEQTLAAYRRAIELGADMIEADVRLTRDGVPVMLHDETLDRTTSGHGPLAELDLNELRKLDAGSWFSPEFAGERVPLLEELVALADAADVALCLEAKSTTTGDIDGTHAMALVIGGAIVRHGRADRDVAASFDHDSLRQMRERHPEVAIAPDRLPERGILEPAAIVAQAQAIGAEIIQHHHEDLAAQTIDACHAAGIAVWPWPVNRTDDIERVVRLGVDGLMGDDVAALVAAVR